MLCGNLEGWDGEEGRRGLPEGGDVGILMLIRVDEWQKPSECGHYRLIRKEKKKRDLSISLEGQWKGLN